MSKELPSTLIREPELWAAMRARFPWIDEERGEVGEGLVHLEFAELCRRVEHTAMTNNVAEATSIFQFIEDLLASPESLHPDVLDGLDVSFLEGLYLSDQTCRAFTEANLPPMTRLRYDEIRNAHERR
jgi:hypothetical protein